MLRVLSMAFCAAAMTSSRLGPHGRLGAADLPHQDLAGHAAAFFPLVPGRGGHIVVGHDGSDFDAFVFRHLHGHLDVHVVAGVVAVEAGHPLAAVCGLEGVEKHLRRRGREDLAHGHGIDHVPADVADEGRLVARAAARDDSHLAGDGGLPELQDARIVRPGDQVRMGLEVALNHFIHRRLRRIDHLLHG